MPSLDSLEKAADSLGYESSRNGAMLKVRIPNVGRFQITIEDGKPRTRTWFGLVPEWGFLIYLFLMGAWTGYLMAQRRGVPWGTLTLLVVVAAAFVLTMWLAQRARMRLFTRATELELGITGLRF